MIKLYMNIKNHGSILFLLSQLLAHTNFSLKPKMKKIYGWRVSIILYYQQKKFKKLSNTMKKVIMILYKKKPQN